MILNLIPGKILDFFAIIANIKREYLSWVNETMKIRKLSFYETKMRISNIDTKLSIYLLIQNYEYD